MTTNIATASRRQVLRSPEADEQLATVGYASTPMLDPAEIDEILRGYRALVPDGDEGLVIDFMRPDRGVLEAVAELLEPVWERHLGDLLVDHRVAVATFVTKHPGEASLMHLHEEPSFVDERRFRSHALWIPLVDVSPEQGNGHLLLLPGSDGLDRGLAGFNTPVQHRPYADALEPHLLPLRSSAGEAVIYGSRTLHASVANRSDAPRPAIAASVVPKEAPLVHVVATGRRRRRIHQVPDDFYLTVHPFTTDLLRLEHPVVEEVDDLDQLDPDALARLVGLPSASALGPARVTVPPDVAAADAAGGGGRPLVRVGDHPRPATTDLVIDVATSAPGPVGDVASVAWASQAEVQASTATGALTVAAGGRIAWSFSTALGSVRAAVRECPMVNAGVAGGGIAHAFDLGEVVDLPVGTELIAWNDGPGVLAIDLAWTAPPPSPPAGAPASRRRSLLRAFRRLR